MFGRALRVQTSRGWLIRRYEETLWVMALKRDTPSFTVEVRQNKRRTSPNSPKPHWVEAHLGLVNAEKPAQRAAAAAFRPTPLFAVAPSPEVEAPAQRRILPSLVEPPVEMVEPATPDDSAPARPRRGRPRKTPAIARPTEEALKSAPAEEVAAEAAPPLKAKVARKPRRRREAPVQVLPPQPVVVESPREADADAEASPVARKPGALIRYGFRDGFKPGEGWKRRREARRARRD